MSSSIFYGNLGVIPNWFANCFFVLAIFMMFGSESFAMESPQVWKRKDGNTSLHEAAIRGDIYSINLLKADRVLRESANALDQTPLFLAVLNSQWQAAINLLDKEASTTKLDKYGRNVLMYAIASFNQLMSDKQKLKLAEEFITKAVAANGDLISETDLENNTIWHIAAKAWSGRLTALFGILAKQKGAKELVNKINKEGKSPLDILDKIYRYEAYYDTREHYIAAREYLVDLEKNVPAHTDLGH